MLYKLDQNYKSLTPFEIELPDFTILTGLNGSGKTHFLEGISDKVISLPQNELRLKPVRYVPIAELNLNEFKTVHPTGETGINRQDQEYVTYKQYMPHVKSVRPALHIPSIVTKIAKIRNKPVASLTIDDYQYRPMYEPYMQINLFEQNLEQIFSLYLARRQENENKKILNQYKGRHEITFLSEGEFARVFGNTPWELVNTVLRESQLDYYLKNPIIEGIDPITFQSTEKIEIQLCRTIDHAPVNFNSLSSGEKILLGLAISSWNLQFGAKAPGMLLLDEPDAYLHPTMVKKLLNVIENIFVKEQKMTVIITTHSPTTVALAPDNSLFVMNKTGTKRVESIAKDKALGILTAGLPSFSIIYENRRQVFVESDNDRQFYESLYNIFLKGQMLLPEISLYFISSGDSRTDKNGMPVSNCDQVENITKTLRGGGNKFVWGIIDWDSKNEGSDHVKILGKGRRYSIENYLLDPILIGLLLFRDKHLKSEEIGLDADLKTFDIQNFNAAQLQTIADNITAKIKQASITDTDLLAVTLVNGWIIRIPKWYLHYQGHQLEYLLAKAYPALHGIKRGKEEALKQEVIEKVIDDYPQFAPKDILDLFKELQE